MATLELNAENVIYTADRDEEPDDSSMDTHNHTFGSDEGSDTTETTAMCPNDMDELNQDENSEERSLDSNSIQADSDRSLSLQGDSSSVEPLPFPEEKQPKWRCSCKPGYLVRASGSLKIVQLLCSLIAMGCMLTARYKHMTYSDLPMNARLKFFIFVCIISIFSCVCFLFIHISTIARTTPLEWALADTVCCAVMFSMFVTGSALVMDAALYYDRIYPEWASVQVMDGSVFGMVCSICYAVGIYFACREWRGKHLFRKRRLEDAFDNPMV